MVAWLFRPRGGPSTAWQVIAWWEVRRIPFNIVVGIYGLFCLVIFYWAIGTSGRLPSGEDAVEPIAILLAPFAINALYTLGWLVEVPAQWSGWKEAPKLGPLLLKLGLGLGIILSSLPAAFWMGYRLLQIAGWKR